jgi:hypothetical protein
VIFNGSDQCALAAGGGENRFDDEGSRALAIRSGDSNDRDSLGGALVEIFTDARQRAASVRHQRPGDSFARRLLRRIGDHGDGARLNGLVDEAVAIRRFAAHGNEQVARLHAARVVFHAGDIGVPAAAEKLSALQQMLESHWIGL